MNKKVIKYIKENNLINSGEHILVALSGGPDSVCLLTILYELRNELNITLGAVHINHQLRGEDSDLDEKYVIDLSNKLGIECYVKRADINRYSREFKLSSEAAGRMIRYDFFEEISKKHGYNKVATAHNANDQAETVLFRLMRGSGLEGLGGIKKIRDGKIIRPIMCLTRKEIEHYLDSKNIVPRIDKTNFEKIYNRNKIRLDILPYIKENFNSDIITTINRTAELLQTDNEFIESQSLKAYKKYCVITKDCIIMKKELFSEHKSIVSRVIRNALSTFSNKTYDFEMKHIFDVIDISNNSTGKSIDLPFEIKVSNIYGDLYIRDKNNQCLKDNEKNELRYSKDKLDNLKCLFNNNILFEFEVMDNNNISFDSKNNERYFSYDNINKEVVIRFRENGDKIVPIGMSGSKKLKDIFIDMKVPKEKRDLVPLVIFDNEIAWIVGLKTSDKFKVNKSTKKILKIKFTQRRA